MKCNEINDLYSEYIDKTLDKRSIELLEEHIYDCKGCREELDALRSCVKELASMEKIAAPEDFLEKVRQRLETRSGFRKMLDIIFLPLHVKIPMEMAGVLILTILVVYTYKTIRLSPEPKQEQFAQAPILMEMKSKALKKDPEEKQPDEKLDGEVRTGIAAIKIGEERVDVAESKKVPEGMVVFKEETTKKEIIRKEHDKYKAVPIEYAQAVIPAGSKTDTIEQAAEKEEYFEKIASAGNIGKQEPVAADAEIIAQQSFDEEKADNKKAITNTEVISMKFTKAEIPLEQKGMYEIKPPVKKDEILEKTASYVIKDKTEQVPAEDEIMEKLSLEFSIGSVNEDATAELRKDIHKPVSDGITFNTASGNAADEVNPAAIYNEIDAEQNFDIGTEGTAKTSGRDLIKVAILIKPIETSFKKVVDKDYKRRSSSSMKMMSESRSRSSISKDSDESSYSDQIYNLPEETIINKAKRPVKHEEKKIPRMPDLNKITDSIKVILEFYEGKDIIIEYNEKTGKPQYITSEIPVSAYYHLLNKLGQIGELVKNKSTEELKDIPLILLRIELLAK